MNSRASQSETGFLRPLVAAFAALLLVAVAAVPVVLHVVGPWAYRQPGQMQKTKSKPPAVSIKERVTVRPHEVDLPGLAARMESEVRKLVETRGPGSRTGRFAGSPEAAAVAEQIAARFRSGGLKNVTVQEFPLVTPVTRKMSFTAGGRSYRLYPLAPNQARTCTINAPGNRLRAPVVWAGDGRLANLRGKRVEGCILVLEEDHGFEWLAACSLGARAAVFIEPTSEKSLRPDLKVLGCPLNIPRFWIDRKEGLRLKTQLLAAEKAGEGGSGPLQGDLVCRVDWETRKGHNIYGIVPGRNPNKLKMTAVVAYYDAPSLVPELAPGAEAAGAVAAMYELMERLKSRPPERSVLFIATGGHQQAMAGEKQAVELLWRPVRKTLSEIGGPEHRDGAILGTDARSVMQAAGQEVSGTTAGQRVGLYVTGFFLLLAAGLFSYFRGLKARSVVVLYACTVVCGGLALWGLGSYLGRERRSEKKTVAIPDDPGKLSAEQKDRWWRDSDYDGVRRALEELAQLEARLLKAGAGGGKSVPRAFLDARDPQNRLSVRLEALMFRRMRAEREAIMARGKLDALLERHRPGEPVSEEYRQQFGRLAMDFEAKARRACDADRELCPLTLEMIKALDWKPEKGSLEDISSDIAALRKGLRIALQDLRKSNRRLFGVMNDCADKIEEMDERLKVEGADRLKYLRLAGYLKLLVSLGLDVPERVSSCVGIDLSSHSERMAVFFKGKHVDHHIGGAEKKLQTAVGLMAEYLAEVGSARARAQGWAMADERSNFVTNTTETVSGQAWGGFAPGTAFYSTEIFTLGGIPSVTFGTAHDRRGAVNTPFDLPERMDFVRLAKQTEVLCSTLADMLSPGGIEFKAADVRNWNRLGSALSSAGKGTAAAYLLGRLSPDARAVLKAAASGGQPGPQDREKVVAALNALLPATDFYDDKSLESLKLVGEAATLRDKFNDPGVEETEGERRRFNLLLIEATLPGQFFGLAERERGLVALERTEAECDFKRGNMTLRIYGQIIEYNPAKSETLSVTPVPRAMVFHRREPQNDRGRLPPAGSPVSPDALFITDRFGAYEFPALSASTQRFWSDKQNHVLAFQTDPATGNIVKAPDRGAQSGKYGEPWRTPKRNEDRFTVTTFGCQELHVFEAVDMRSLETKSTQFTNLTMYKGTVDAVPITFGWANTGITRGLAYPEHAMVVYTERLGEHPERNQPPRPVQLKMTFGRPDLAGVKWPVLGVTPRELTKANHTGHGLSVSGSSRLINPDTQKRDDKGVVDPASGATAPLAMIMAQDLYRLDDYRLKVLKKAGVSNQALVSQHRSAGRDLQAAIAAREQMLWDEMLIKARSAWGYEARAYPNIQNTVTDVVKGLLFYLFLMLPFAYFMERLIFAFPDINRQLAGVFGLFMVSFAVLYFVHPAFGITSSAPMILLSFITLALSILVMGMVSARFRRELEALQHRPGRSHKADMDRFNAAISAFLLGINNMRRRKVRTILTMITLVLLTFSVLSFSSIESTLGANKRVIETDGPPAYRGILVRSESWGALDPYAARSLRDEYQGPDCIVSPRAWSRGKRLHRAGALEAAQSVPGMLGVHSAEREVTGLGADRMLVAGRWFTEEEGRAALPICLLDEELMVLLELDVEAVTAVRNLADPESRKALPKVIVAGEELSVIGVLKSEAYQETVDIDNERIVPVDWSVENWSRRRGKGAGSEEIEFENWKHVEAVRVPVVPYSWLMNRGGSLYSVALKPGNPADVKRIAEGELLRRLSVPMFVADDVDEAERSEDIRTMFMSSAAGNTVSGVGSLVVPMLIAALIVLNTMLGSVYERENEISIYGSLGLAPVHIGSLFIAESAVYAVVSAVMGYILGQSVSKVVVILASSGIMTGFNLNYSSLSAVFSACFIIGVVMASAAYPAMRAGQLSVPDVERIWKFPEPEGDRLVFLFPFTVSGEQALGINKHLMSFFEDHANQSVGEFYTAKTEFNYRQPGIEKGGYRLNCDVWIAPFDFGISQHLELDTYLAEGEEDIYETSMVLTRKSGSPDSWVKMNHRFMKSIRKQFLLWRLFTTEERAWHVAQARVVLGEISEDEVPDRVAEADAERGEAAPEAG